MFFRQCLYTGCFRQRHNCVRVDLYLIVNKVRFIFNKYKVYILTQLLNLPTSRRSRIFSTLPSCHVFEIMLISMQCCSVITETALVAHASLDVQK